MIPYSNLERDAQKMSQKVRAEAGFGNEPISDIFSLMEKLSILYLRYPLGDKAIEGYVIRRGGKNVVFTNSSYSKGKEIFTVAHEIGHIHLDMAGQDLIVDQQIVLDDPNLQETRANYFAANFLMPASTVFSFLKDYLGVTPEGITAKHIVFVQQNFMVSYQAALIRLKSLDLISKKSYEEATRYGGYMSLAELVKKCGFDIDLLVPDAKIHVPVGILQKVIELYENERIPYGSMSYFLNLLGKTPQDFDFEPGKAVNEDAGN